MSSEIQCQAEIIPQTPITEPEESHVWTDEEKVEYLYDRQWAVSRIARKTGLSANRIRELLDEIDERRFAEIEKSPRRRKAGYVAVNKAIMAAAWEKMERGGNARLLKLVLEAQNQNIKVLGDYAPTHTINVDLTERSLINPAIQARIMARPEAMAALVALEEMAAEEQAATEEGGER